MITYHLFYLRILSNISLKILNRTSLIVNLLLYFLTTNLDFESLFSMTCHSRVFILSLYICSKEIY